MGESPNVVPTVSTVDPIIPSPAVASDHPPSESVPSVTVPGTPSRAKTDELAKMQQQLAELRTMVLRISSNESMRMGLPLPSTVDPYQPGSRWHHGIDHCIFIGEERKHKLQPILPSGDSLDTLLPAVRARLVTSAGTTCSLAEMVSGLAELELQDQYKQAHVTTLLSCIRDTPVSEVTPPKDDTSPQSRMVQECLTRLEGLGGLQSHAKELEKKTDAFRLAMGEVGKHATGYGVAEYVTCERGWRAQAAELEHRIQGRQERIVAQLEQRREKFDRIHALLREVDAIDEGLVKEDNEVRAVMSELENLDARCRRFLGAVQQDIASDYIACVTEVAETFTREIRLQSQGDKHHIHSILNSAYVQASTTDKAKLRQAARDNEIQVQQEFFDSTFSGLDT